MDGREFIARRTAQEFSSGDIINLGFGMPINSADYVDPNLDIYLQTENGVLMFGEKPNIEDMDPDYTSAGPDAITLKPGASLFDLPMSFAIIRGGHVDITVLGALEVDGNGSIANWNIPGVFSPGMGGAMDLLVGAKKIIVNMTHLDKYGKPKILKECKLPLSAYGVVDLIITDKAVMEFTDRGLVLKEVREGHTPEEIVKMTEADLIIDKNVKIV